MSSHEDSERAVERAALGKLESAVDAALAEITALRERARDAETRNAELESLLERFGSGQENPKDYEDRLRVLESENGDLKGRLEKGHEAVGRLLARVRFLEEQR